MLKAILVLVLSNFPASAARANAISIQRDVEIFCERLRQKGGELDAGSNFVLTNNCRAMKGLPRLKSREEKKQEELLATCNAIIQGKAHHNVARDTAHLCPSIPKAPLPKKIKCLYISRYNPNVCTFPADHPDRPKTSHYESKELKLKVIKHVMHMAGVDTNSLYVDHQILRAQIIGQANQRSRGASGCWGIRWHPQRRIRFTFTSVGSGTQPGISNGWKGGYLGSEKMSAQAISCLERGGVIDGIWDN